MRKPRHILEYGPDALLLTWEDRIDPAISAGVHAYAALVRSHPAVRECVPAYASLLLRFDPAKISVYQLREWLFALDPEPAKASKARRHRLPVVYGGDYGPDLEELAATLALTPERLIELHQQPTYRVYQLGYQPGFAFLGLTPPELETPRRADPRPRVPAGSVGLAGRQTGIYPLSAPGGWQLIGRCPALLWDAEKKTPARLWPGDEVQFFAVPATEWETHTKKFAAWKI